MRTHSKYIAWFVFSLIFFQSCASAKSVNVDKAVLDGKRVQIKTVQGEKYRYKKLIKRESILYGVKKIESVGLVEQDLSQLNISEIKYVSPTFPLVIVSFLGLAFIFAGIATFGGL